jgi:hypothetical protein
MKVDEFKPVERLLSKKQVAIMYGCHYKTVETLEKQGKIPARVEDYPLADARWLESEIVSHLRGMRRKAEAV